LRVLFYAPVLLLSACASVPDPHTPAPDAAVREAFLASHPDWRIEGRVAYSHQGKGGSARLVWLQDGEQADVRLTAPLAAGSVHIRLSRDSAEIIDADGRLLAQGTPESVFMQVLQSPVPTNALPAGLRAFWPDLPPLTEAALTGSVTVDGWRWQYLEWQDAPVRLPRKIELTRAETRLRILIDVWQELPHD
jgi:outer membrane lipoprotein LolB